MKCLFGGVVKTAKTQNVCSSGKCQQVSYQDVEFLPCSSDTYKNLYIRL